MQELLKESESVGPFIVNVQIVWLGWRTYEVGEPDNECGEICDEYTRMDMRDFRKTRFPG